MSYTESERSVARLKSYVTPAVVTMVLYLFLFVPGLIANYLYRKEAFRMQYIADERLPGVGCLNTMWQLAMAALVFAVIVVVYALYR